MELKRTWKRIIAAFLTFAMTLTFIPNIPALANDVPPADEYAITVNATNVHSDGAFTTNSCTYGDWGYYNYPSTVGGTKSFLRSTGFGGDTNNHYNTCIDYSAASVNLYRDGVSITNSLTNSNVVVSVTGYSGGKGTGRVSGIKIELNDDALPGTYTWSVYQTIDVDYDCSSLSSLDDGTYQVAEGSFTIAKRTVYLETDDVDMYYGANGKKIQYSYTVSGAVSNDTAADIVQNVYSYAEGSASADTLTTNHQADMIKHASGYVDEFLQNDWSKARYTVDLNYFNAHQGNFNLRQIHLDELTVSFVDAQGNSVKQKEYDGLDFDRQPTFTYDNKPITLDVGLDYDLSWILKEDGKEYKCPNKAGEYTAVIKAHNPEDQVIQTNVINEHKGFKFTVTKKPITIMPLDQEFTYDGNTKAVNEGNETNCATYLTGNKVEEDGQDPTYEEIKLAASDQITDFALTIGDGSEEALWKATSVADPEKGKVAGSVPIKISADDITISRKEKSTSGDLAAGTDVTDSYEITVAGDGALTINPKDNAGSAAAVQSSGTVYFAKIENKEVDWNGEKQSLDDANFTDNAGQYPGGDLAQYLTVEYSEDGGKTWSTKKPTYTDVGKYTIDYRIAHGAEYNNGVPNEDVHFYDLLYKEIVGKATLTITGVDNEDAEVTVKDFTYGDKFADRVKVVDNDENDITKKDDFTDSTKTITYRYIADLNPSAENPVAPASDNNEWVKITDNTVIPAGYYWVEATIPEYGQYAESKVYAQFSVAKKEITVSLNDIALTAADDFAPADINTYVPNSKKYTYDGVVGDDDPLAETACGEGHYSDVVVTDEYGHDVNAFCELGIENYVVFVDESFDDAEDVFDNYVIAIDVDEALITTAPVDIADIVEKDAESGKLTGTVVIGYADYAGPKHEDNYEWTGNPAGPEVSEIALKKATKTTGDITENDVIALTADDYTVKYFKRDDDGIIPTQVSDTCPTDRGDYVLVIAGKNVAPGSEEAPVSATAKVYGTYEVPFSIIGRAFILHVQPENRDYEQDNKLVEMNLRTATLEVYSEEAKDFVPLNDDELKAQILADDNIKNLTGEMQDANAGNDKPVVVNGGNVKVELADQDMKDSYVVTLMCGNPEKPCETTVNINRAEAQATLTIGGEEDASWQYGDFENGMETTALAVTVQDANLEDVDVTSDPTYDSVATYYYTWADIDDDTPLPGLENERWQKFKTIEELQANIKSNKDKVGKYSIYVEFSEGTNYHVSGTWSTVTVNKRNITITANEQYRYYMDDKVADLDISSDAYVITHVKDNKDVVEDKNKIFYGTGASLTTVITGSPSCDGVTDERTQDVGDFDIVEGDLAVANDFDGNYTINFVEGTFRILPLPLDNVYPKEYVAGESYPQIAEGFEVQVRLEKDEYLYDGQEKTPEFTVVYTRGDESYTVPQEQYMYYYTENDGGEQTTVKAPGDYDVRVYKANKKDNLKDKTIARGDFEITKIPVTVFIKMEPAEGGAVSRSYDGTNVIKGVKYTATLMYKKDEYGDYDVVPNTESVSALKEKFSTGPNGDPAYIAELKKLVLPSADAGAYELGTGKNDISVDGLNKYFAGAVDEFDLYEYKLEGAEYTGTYTVNKAEVVATVADIKSVEYNGDYQTPDVTVTYKPEGSDKNLIKESDYTVTYRNNRNVTTGTNYAIATVRASEDGNFIFTNATEGKIEKPFEITPKKIILTSKLALEDKEYDGKAEMKLIGNCTHTDFVDDETVSVKYYYKDAVTEHAVTPKLDGTDVITVSDKNVGTKTAEIYVRLDGEDAGNYVLSIEYANEDTDEDDNRKATSLDEDDEKLLNREGQEITVSGKIYKKDVTVSNDLSLVDKVYDGNTKMSVDGEATLEGIIEGEENLVTLAEIKKNVNVANANAGDKTYTFNLSLVGEAEDTGNYNLTTTTATAKGKITKKDVTVKHDLKLTNKVFDGTAAMSVTGSASLVGVINKDDVKLAGADAKSVNVANANKGEKTYTFTLSLTGKAKDNYNLKTTSATAKGKITGTLTAKGIYCMQVNPNIVAGMVTEKSDAKDSVEYRWEAIDADHPEKGWFEVSSWKKDNEWLDWTPNKAGNYVIVCHARIIGVPNSEVTSSFGTPYKVIKGIAQIPYTGEGGGYLIGFETYNNPNQSYRYEVLILDCTLYNQGLPAWIYSTKPQTVASGNAFWTVWQPDYGYYWTLFRVYDAKGNLVDEEVFGFENVK